jgi:hypothetical protein
MKEILNDGHYLELMDRIHIINCTINDHLLTHPVANADSRVHSLLDKAIDELMDAYQIIGELIVEKQIQDEQLRTGS